MSVSELIGDGSIAVVPGPYGNVAVKGDETTGTPKNVSTLFGSLDLTVGLSSKVASTVMFSGANEGLYASEEYKNSSVMSKLNTTVIESAWTVPHKAKNVSSRVFTVTYSISFTATRANAQNGMSLLSTFFVAFFATFLAATGLDVFFAVAIA
jgi:hypothetical protein